METKKINFFSRAIKAIAKFDQYEFFIEEKITVAISYILKLVLIISLIISLAVGYKTIDQMKKIYADVALNIPEFKFEENTLKIEEAKEMALENDFYLIFDTNPEIEQSKIDEYKKKVEEHQAGIVFLNNRALLKISNFQEYNYKDITEEYGIQNTSFSKQEAIDYINTNVMVVKTYLGIFALIYISFFVATIISLISDIILLAILGAITSKLCKVNLKFSAVAIIAIYSITLPLLLLGLYQIALSLFNFRIDYFNIMYIAIGYIYVVAAILIMKSNQIKQTAEINKIVTVEKQVKEELKESKEEEDKKEEKPTNEKEKEPDINEDEPDGSEI